MKNKKRLTVFFIGGYILFLGFSDIYLKNSLEDLYYVSQVVSSIFVVGGLVVSVLQYLDTAFVNRDVKIREKKVKAAEMANNFQKELIPLMKVVSQAYSDSELNNTILNKLRNTNLAMFNKEEMLEIFSEEEIAKAVNSLHVAYLVKNYKPIVEEHDSQNKKQARIEYDKEDMRKAFEEFDNAVTNLSNSLEYFSINFNSGLADADAVYQSLHGIFFKCVEMLYIFMFYRNESESDRLFSNTSNLYTNWKKKHDDLVKEEKEEINKMRSRVKKKIVVEA